MRHLGKPPVPSHRVPAYVTSSSVDRKRARPNRMSNNYYESFSDERLVEIICDMIDRNKKRDFLQLTTDIGKHRLSRLLTHPIERTSNQSRDNMHYNSQKPDKNFLLDDDAESTISGSILGGQNGLLDYTPISQGSVDLWWTPLHFMVKLNRIEMVTAAAQSIEEMLTQLSGTSNWPDVFGQTPLHVACIKGHVAVCRMLCRQATFIQQQSKQNTRQTVQRESILNLINTVDKIGCAPLHYAVMLQHRGQAEELAKLLLSNGCDPNIADNDGFTPLSLTAYRGNFELTMLLISNGATPNHQSLEDGWTPLMLAAYAGHIKIVSALLNPQQALTSDAKNNTALVANPAITTANPALTNKLGATVLIVAAQKGQSDVVSDMLLSSKPVCATLNVRDVAGRTALAAAAIKGHSQVVTLLLERRADANIADNEGATPLMLAVANGYRNVVDALLQYGADVTVQDETGCNAIMIAASTASVEMMRALLSAAVTHGVTLSSLVNAQQRDGTTALMIASTKGNDKVVELLVNAQASLEPSRVLVDDWTALFHAVHFEKTKIVRGLLAKQQSTPVSASPSGGLMNRILTEVNRQAHLTKLTPLLLATLAGNAHITRVLIDSGANPNTYEQTFFTPLMAAIQCGDEKLTQLLLMKGAKTDAQEHKGYSPLMIAACNGSAKLCDMLMQQGASANLQQINGRTALMFAAEKGFYDVLKVIIRRGCDPSITDVFGRTALHYGIIGGNEKVTTLLCDCPGIDPNLQDREGASPVMVAASNPKAKKQEPSVEGERSGGKLLQEAQQQAEKPHQAFGGPPPEILHVLPLLRLKTINLELRDIYGDTALLRAYRIENWACAEALLRAGASCLAEAMSDCLSPFILAAINGYLQGIKLIKHLAHRAVNITDQYGRTALFHAVLNDNLDAVNLLLSEPAPTDVKIAPSRHHRHRHLTSDSDQQQQFLKSPHTTDLHSPDATSIAHTPTVEKMWFYGMSPLHIAAKRGCLAVAERLIEAGANVHQVNEKRETPLMLACAGSHWDLVELFLGHGSSVSHRDTAGQTVLHRLCYIGDEYEAARGFRIFVKHRGTAVLDTAVDAPGGNTALHWAVICDLPEVVNELIILGASREIKNKEGKTPHDTVVFAPLLFDSLGEVIGSQWRTMVKYLKKQELPSDDASQTPTDSKPSSPESMFNEEELSDIEGSFNKGENYDMRCASMMVEKFYEKCEESSSLDTATLGKAWKEAFGNSLPPVLEILFDHCKGKTLIFRNNTLENLTKFRSKSSMGNVHIIENKQEE